MSYRWLWTGVPLGALALSLSASACGSYEAPNTTGGAPGAGGTATGSGGAAATGGATSSSGGAAVGTGGAAVGTGGEDTGAGGGPPPEPPEASCENAPGCGGKIEGLWFAQKSCLSVSGVVDLEAAAIGCPEATITGGKVEVSGNWLINADGTISDNTNSISEVTFELEQECLDVSGTVTKCPNIGLPLTGMGFDDVQCADSTVTAGGCTCTGTANQQGGMGYVLGFNAETSGQYTVAGNTLTADGTGPEDLGYSFCVEEPFMVVTPTAVMETGTLTGTIVLQRQD